MDNLPKDFNPKSCLFSFKYDEQTGKICSAITVEHYDGKGSVIRHGFWIKSYLESMRLIHFLMAIW